MKISELLERLGELQGEYGDIEVWADTGEGAEPDFKVDYADRYGDPHVEFFYP